MNLFRKNIDALKPYIPGKQPKENIVKLNANENPYPPSPKVVDAINNFSKNCLRYYSDAVSEEVRKTATDLFQVNLDEVIVGNGSDDVLTMIIRTFLESDDKIAVVDPSYTLYEILADIHGVETEKFSLEEDYSLPENFFTTKAKIKFLPNPNAQTGTLFSKENIDRLCTESSGVVVIDEAYAAFANVTSIPLIKKYKNLIVLRTLSKSHSLAGMRIGFGFATSEIIAGLMKVKDSYNVNSLSQAAATAAFKDDSYVQKNIKTINETRNWFASELVNRGWKVVPSNANFVLAKPSIGTAKEIYARLEKSGYLVRHFSTPRLNDKLRISIGTKEQMLGLLNSL